MAKKTEPQFEFKNDADRNSAAEELLNLKNQPGWQRLEKYYDGKIKYFELLLAEGEIKDMEELKLLRARRKMAIQFKNLPDIIIEFLEKGVGNSPDLDPYEK